MGVSKKKKKCVINFVVEKKQFFSKIDSHKSLRNLFFFYIKKKLKIERKS